jgi:16S rRNA G966 N2-methylase RsmD
MTAPLNSTEPHAAFTCAESTALGTSDGMGHQPKAQIAALYKHPIPSTRSGAIYNAFSYPTKIDAEAIAIYIAVHTKPGDTVLDPFAGSGSTGVAARLCGAPTRRMLKLVEEAGLQPTWGPRNAVLYELSKVGALLASVMTSPPDPVAFEARALEVLSRVSADFADLYAAKGPDGRIGQIRHTVWTEIVVTPCCRVEQTLWDAAVTLDPAAFATTFNCPDCGSKVAVGSCIRKTGRYRDDVTGRQVVSRKRVPAFVYGSTDGTNWSRPATADDRRRLTALSQRGFPKGAPTDEIVWGDLRRTGYHLGIERFHHLYTRRNLWALSAIWEAIENESPELRDALRLWALSYNASHSTLMARVVAKSGQRDLVVTGSQSGVLYVSGLPVEKNVFSGLARKVDTFAEAFGQARTGLGAVKVVNGSSTSMALDDGTIDYVFTDPPFGDYIPYAEVNQVNEAWLGVLTDRRNEAIVSTAQGKGITEYGKLMKQVFGEVRRVLKDGAHATVVFHASKPAVWEALGDAFGGNGLVVERTSVLDKTQVSFKQVVGSAGTRGDAVFLLVAGTSNEALPGPDEDLPLLIDTLIAEADGQASELEPQRLFSRYAASCMAQGKMVTLSSGQFLRLARQRLRETKRASA